MEATTKSTTDTSESAKRSEKVLRTKLSVAIGAVAALVLWWQGTVLTDSQAEKTEAEQARIVAERERDEQLRRAELIIVSAPVTLVMCGEDRVITICNPKSEEMFGWKRDELLGEKIDILIPKSLIPSHEAGFTKALKAAKDGPDNYMIRRVGVRAQGKHKDGHLFDVIISIRAIKYGGKVEFIASIRPPKEVPSIDKVPLPNMHKRRERQQNVRRSFKK